MKRFHVHVSVEKLDDSIRFYTSLFGTAPTMVQPDYAKWMLDDPRVNFAISQRGRQPGVNHLGFQVEDESELKAMRGQLEAADAGLLEQTNAACCYAISDKYWVTDPQGVAWETFTRLIACQCMARIRAPLLCRVLVVSRSRRLRVRRTLGRAASLPQAVASTSDKTCCP